MWTIPIAIADMQTHLLLGDVSDSEVKGLDVELR
jgi:hypothetical protein